MHVPRDLMVLALEEKGWETTQKVLLWLQSRLNPQCPAGSCGTMSWASLSCSQGTAAAQHWDCPGNIMGKGFTSELDLCFRIFTVSQGQRSLVQEGKGLSVQS